MEQTNRNPGRMMCDLMFEALKSEAPVLNQLATELLVATGIKAVHELIIEALTSKRVGYRLRLLHVIERIGHIPDPADHMELFGMSGDKDPKVRDAVARAIAAVRPHGHSQQATVPETAEL